MQIEVICTGNLPNIALEGGNVEWMFLIGKRINFSELKWILNWAEPCKCVVLLVSKILWHKRINPSLKEWRFWYLILTSHFFCHNFFFPVYTVPYHPVKDGEASKKQVPLKSYSLEIRIDSVNQILKNKEKVK